MSNNSQKANDEFRVNQTSSLSQGAAALGETKSGCIEKSLNSQTSTTTAGNYEILHDLGEGTFGSVKLGKHSQKGTLVAVKILEKSRI